MSIRTFIAIDIGALPELVKFEEELAGTGANLKLVKPENIHITLKFLGNTEKEQLEKIKETIADVVTGTSKFKLEFTGAGAFPNLNYIKVLWVGINDNGILAPIASELDKKLHKIGFQREKRTFKPHITLGRLKGFKNKNDVKKILKQHSDRYFGELDVNNIRLKKSILNPEGPIYSTLEEIILE
jgi:2'-5' RNA ligase